MVETQGRALSRISSWWTLIEQTLTGLLGLGALVIAMLQILGRYIDPAHAIHFADEVLVYALIWAIMIMASQLVRTDGHVRPDLVLRLMPVRAQRWVESLNCVVAIIFCGGLVWYGIDIVQTAQMLDERSTTELNFPMWLYYLALPTGSGLMAIRYLFRLARFLFAFDPASMSVGHVAALDAPLDAGPAPRA